MFEKEDTKDQSIVKQQLCQCQSNQLFFMPTRQVSLVVAAFLLLSFLLFMGGYFLGQKQVIAGFSDKIEQESFSDHIYSSMCSMVDTTQDDQEIEEGETQEGTAEIKQDEKILISTDKEQQIEPSVDSIDAVNQSNQESNSTTEYFAQLVGFSIERPAQQFAQRLIKKEISVIVKKRQSRTSRGKFVYWYQVITEKYNDRAQLEELVAKLTQEEKLKDVQIITC